MPVKTKVPYCRTHLAGAPKSKKCTKCGKRKKLEAFSRAGNGERYGRKARCRACSAVDAAAYRASPEAKAAMLAWVHRNREKLKAHKAAYYVKNRKRHAAHRRAWYAANVDKVKAYELAYRAENREQIRVVKEAWYEANKNRPEYKASMKAAARKHYHQNRDWRNWINNQSRILRGGI